METQRKALSFKGQNIYIGIDVHLKSWSVTLMSEATQLKRFSQSPDPDALYAHLVRNYPEAEYHSVYEAGFCGFWIHYRLVGLGIHNIVVNFFFGHHDLACFGWPKFRIIIQTSMKWETGGLRLTRLSAGPLSRGLIGWTIHEEVLSSA